jgi:hypothetical protein
MLTLLLSLAQKVRAPEGGSIPSGNATRGPTDGAGRNAEDEDVGRSRHSERRSRGTFGRGLLQAANLAPPGRLGRILRSGRPFPEPNAQILGDCRAHTRHQGSLPGARKHLRPFESNDTLRGAVGDLRAPSGTSGPSVAPFDKSNFAVTLAHAAMGRPGDSETPARSAETLRCGLLQSRVTQSLCRGASRDFPTPALPRPTVAPKAPPQGSRDDDSARRFGHVPRTRHQGR